MNLPFLILIFLIHLKTYSQNLNNNTKISVMLMNCYEGNSLDDTKRDLSSYYAIFKKEKYLTTNFDIKRYNQDSVVKPKFIIKGLDSIKVTTYGKWINRQMYPGETIVFSLPKFKKEERDRTYLIYTKGKLVETENNKFPYFEKLIDYELRVESGDKNESILKMDLSSFPSGGFDGGIYLYWIGDLNGDNYLDMLVGSSTHYTQIELILYLSNKIEKGLFQKHKVGVCSSC